MPELTTAPVETSIADADELYFNDVSETPDALNRITFSNMIGTALLALRSVFVAATASGPASLALHEDTDNGTNKVTLIAPATIASDKTQTLQDVTGTVIVTGGSDLPVADGGTGASTAAGAATNLGLGTGDSPEFAGVNIGHATDTTLTRSSAGNVAVEGNLIYRAGGTDVPVADGGTGASTAAAGLANLEGAPLASPALTGNPTAPTPAAGDNDTSIATTAFVRGEGVGILKYRALLTFADDVNPTIAATLENTIGAVVWARTGEGVYTGTLASAFTADKVFCTFTNARVDDPTTGGVIYSLYRINVNAVELRTFAIDGTASDITTATGAGSVQILIYP